MKEILIKCSKGATIPVAQYENRSVHYTCELRTDEDVDKVSEYEKIDSILDQLVEREINAIKGTDGQKIIYATQAESEKARMHSAEALIDNTKTVDELKEVGKAIAKILKRFRNADNIDRLRAHYELKQDELKDGE